LKILHTGDFHLNENAPERWDALREVTTLALENQVTVLVIAGDLFDKDVAAENLRAKLRSYLSNKAFQTVILPGNHDYRAYRSGLYFGENLTVLDSADEPVKLGSNVVLWGVPYKPVGREQMAANLREMAARMDPSLLNIIIFHGELLDAYFAPQEWGDEGFGRHMPVRLAFFEPLPVQYVLAGHFHSRFSVREIPGGGLFIYPGSPVSVTKKEIGQRMVNFLAIGEDPQEMLIDSFHFENIYLSLNPFSGENPLIELERKLASLHPHAKILLTVEGLFNGEALGLSEIDLAERLSDLAGNRLADDPVFNFIDVQNVFEDDLFQDFTARLENSEHSPEIKEQARKLAIRAMRVVLS